MATRVNKHTAIGAESSELLRLALRRSMCERDWGPKDIAEVSGLNYETVSHVTRGKYVRVSEDVAAKLCNAIGILPYEVGI